MKEKLEVQCQAEKVRDDLQKQVKALEIDVEEQVSRFIELEQEKNAAPSSFPSPGPHHLLPVSVDLTPLGTSCGIRQCLSFLTRFIHGAHFLRVYPWCRMYNIVVVQSVSCVPLFETLWTAARQASLSFTISRSLLQLMSTESVMPSNH